MEFKRSRTSWSNVKPRFDHAPRLEDLVDVLDFTNKKWVNMRPVGDVVADGVHWIKFTTKAGKEVSIPKTCLAFDAQLQDRDTSKPCPYCDLENANFSVVYYGNVISRAEQDNKPRKATPPTSKEKKTGLKEKGSSTWTPVRVARYTGTVINTLLDLGERNIVRKGDKERAFPLSHEKYGRDVSIKYNKDEKGPKKYTIDKGERTPLTEEELEYLLQNLDLIPPPDDLKTAKAEAKKFASMAPGASEDDDDDRKSKKSKSRNDEDDDDLDEDDDEPKSKSKKKPAPKSKSRDDDDDDLDEDLDDDDDDLDDDEDDLDDDDEPKSKSKKKPVSKSKSRDEDGDEDDLDGDEDGDEDDEEPRSKKSSSKSKVKSKSHDDDDDLDDLDDHDEDEEDEKPVKKSSRSKKPVTKAKSKSRSRDDDFDEDEDED